MLRVVVWWLRFVMRLLLISLLGMMILRVSIPWRTTWRMVISLTTPAVPSSSSMRSPRLKGLVELSMNPQNISDRTGLAAKPAMAARTAVPWKREAPKSRVISLDMMTHIAAMKIMMKRITFSV